MKQMGQRCMVHLELHSQLASLVQSTPWYRTMKLSRLYPARRIASELHRGTYMNCSQHDS